MLICTQIPEKYPFISWKKQKIYLAMSRVEIEAYVAEITEEEEAALYLLCRVLKRRKLEFYVDGQRIDGVLDGALFVAR